MQISDSELILMRIVWQNNSTIMLAQIMDILAAQGNTWNRNTVTTLLSRLVHKGFLRTEKSGRRNIYSAAIDEAACQAELTRDLVDRMYHGQASGLITALARSDMLTQEDCEELLAFLEQERTRE